jgi:hypothetical protein
MFATVQEIVFSEKETSKELSFKIYQTSLQLKRKKLSIIEISTLFLD